jgi:hypothetical protein
MHDQKKFYALINQGHPVANAQFSLVDAAAQTDWLDLLKWLKIWFKVKPVSEQHIWQIANAHHAQTIINRIQGKRTARLNAMTTLLNQNNGQLNPLYQNLNTIHATLKKLKNVQNFWNTYTPLSNKYDALKTQYNQFFTDLNQSQGDKAKILALKQALTNWQNSVNQTHHSIVQLFESAEREAKRQESSCLVQ